MKENENEELIEQKIESIKEMTKKNSEAMDEILELTKKVYKEVLDWIERKEQAEKNKNAE